MNADIPGTVPDPQEPGVGARAELLPEELAAGSANPLTQLEAILEESRERTDNPEPTIRRTAEDATGSPTGDV